VIVFKEKEIRVYKGHIVSGIPYPSCRHKEYHGKKKETEEQDRV
jgi:hypothetical protein